MLTWMDIHRKELGGGRGHEFGEGSTASIPWGRRRDDFLGGFRPPSLLERSLFSRLGNHVSSSPPLITGGGQISKTAQLTIFYDGNVSTYDNVSVDKAHEIMVLANQYSSTSSDHSSVHYHAPTKLDFSMLSRRRELDFTSKTSIPSMSLLEEDNITKDVPIPIARQQSIKRFLEKRRNRVSNQFPYGKSG